MSIYFLFGILIRGHPIFTEKLRSYFTDRNIQFCDNTTSIVAHGGLWWAYRHKESSKPPKLKYETL